MNSSMNSSPLNTLSAGTLALLRKHNLLKQLVSAEVIKSTVEDIEIPQDHQKELLDANNEESNLGKH